MTTTATAAVPQAQTLWDKGDYRHAFAAAFQAATEGDPQAQFLLGEAYRLGRSVDPDMYQARDWYSRAARQGDVASAAALGELLVHMRQPQDAVPWLTLAASHNHAHATALLAAIYFTGDGVDRDLILATSLMKKAAAEGFPEARERLAFMDDTAPPVDVSTSPDPLPRPVEALAQSTARPATPKPVVVSSQIKPARTVAVSFRLSKPAHAVRFQVGAFRSAENARRARSLIATRLSVAPASLLIVRSRGFYEVQLISAGLEPARSVRARLTAIGWQHFVRSAALKRTNRT